MAAIELATCHAIVLYDCSEIVSRWFSMQLWLGDMSRLTSSSPPHLSHENETREDRRLEHSQEDPTDDEAGKVGSGGGSSGTNTPSRKVEHDPVFHCDSDRNQLGCSRHDNLPSNSPGKTIKA